MTTARTLPLQERLDLKKLGGRWARAPHQVGWLSGAGNPAELIAAQKADDAARAAFESAIDALTEYAERQDGT